MLEACGTTPAPSATAAPPSHSPVPVAATTFCTAVTAVSGDVTPLNSIDATSALNVIKPAVAKLDADFDVLDQLAPGDIVASVHPVRLMLDAGNAAVQSASTNAGTAAGLSTITTALNSTSIGAYVTAHCSSSSAPARSSAPAGPSAPARASPS